jgi:MoxR-like ATPase
VGKTTLAEAWARATGARLERLSCYEGLGREEALYDWDYGRQILTVRLAGVPPKGIVQGAALRVRGLSAAPRSMADRSGITYRAEVIEPLSPARQAS